MKFFSCCLHLVFATAVVTAPIRAQRENVLSFLTDALDTASEKTIPETTPAYRNPPSKPVKEQDSKDVSEAKSTESFDTNGFTDAFKDSDSHEIVMPKVVEKDRRAPGRKTGDKGSTWLMDMSSSLVQDHGSREHSGPHQASREQTDLNSEEGMMGDAQHAESLSGKPVTRLSRDQVIDSGSLGSNLQRKATPGRQNGLNGKLPPGQSRELVDWDSLEDNNDRPAPVGNRGNTNYDETREFVSSEAYSVGALAPPAHMSSSLFVPGRKRAS